MSYNLILDDERSTEMIVNCTNNEWYLSQQFIFARTYEEFCEIIDDMGLPNFISFDHDIADFKNGEERTGKTAAQFVIDYCIDNDLDFPNYMVHSSNPRGAENIQRLVDDFILKRSEGFFN